MPNTGPIVPDTTERESADVLCAREDCVAGVVSRSVQDLISRTFSAVDHLDVVMEQIFCTSILLALLEAHGVPLDTPPVGSEITLPIVNRIGAEMGLIGCTAIIATPTRRKVFSGH